MIQLWMGKKNKLNNFSDSKESNPFFQTLTNLLLNHVFNIFLTKFQKKVF